MKKLICILFLCVLLIGTIVGLYQNNNYMLYNMPINVNEKANEEIVDVQEESLINYAYTTLDPVTKYKDEMEMINDHKVSIVSGRVVETNVFISSGMVFTNCTVELADVYRGNNMSETIQVLEMGGKLNEEQAILFANKEGYDSFPEGLLVNYSGYQTSSVGDNVVFFLTKCEDDMITDVLGKRSDLYYVAGAVQGKYVLENNYYVSYASNDTNTRMKYAVKEFYTLIEQNLEK